MNPILLVLVTFAFLVVTVTVFVSTHKQRHKGELSKNVLSLIVYLLISTALILLWNAKFLISPNIGIYDWKKEIYFFHFLRSSLVEFGEFPFSFVFLSEGINWYPTLSKTLSYWANPEVLTFSPLLILIPFLSTVAFIKTYFFLYLLFGAVGIFVLFRRLGLGVYETLIVFMMTILNPWLMQHLAIGYTPWIQFCMVPMTVAMLVNWRTQITPLVVASCLNALIIYGGGLHIFLWFNAAVAIFYIVFALRRKALRVLTKAFLFFLMTGLLILPKIVAILSVFEGWTRGIKSSYSSLSHLWGLLTDSNAPLYDLPRSYNIYGVNLYDGSILMGPWFIVLLAFCVIFSLYNFVKSDRQSTIYPQFPSFELVLVALLFCFLGWDGIWKNLVDMFPLLGSQIYPWRFSFVSLFLLIVFVVWESLVFARTFFHSNLGMKIVISLLFVPLVFTAYTRNRLFVNVATVQPDPLSGYSLRILFDQHGVGVSSRSCASTPNRITICDTETGQVSLPWLSEKHLDEFHIKNAEFCDSVSNDNGVTFRVIDKTRPVVIRPKRFHMGPLLALALFLYAGVAYFVWRYQQRRQLTAESAHAADPPSAT